MSGYAAYDGNDGAYSYVEQPVMQQQAVRQVQVAQQPQQPQQQPQQPPPMQQPIQQQPLQQQSYALPVQTEEERQLMYFQLQERLQMQQQQQGPGTLERLWQRRRDVMKLVVMSTVVLLALSSHAVMWHYLEAYVDDARMTAWREFATRLAYPVGALALMWLLKASQQAR